MNAPPGLHAFGATYGLGLVPESSAWISYDVLRADEQGKLLMIHVGLLVDFTQACVIETSSASVPADIVQPNRLEEMKELNRAAKQGFVGGKKRALL